MRIIDTSDTIFNAYVNGEFNLDKWQKYMDKALPNIKELCLEDMKEVIKAGYSYEECFLPILNKVYKDQDKYQEALKSFRLVIKDLDQKLIKRFGRTVDADIILYLGLGNGAGWVIDINNRITILLGIEKIIELDWVSTQSMNALILHELGHAYQDQYGNPHPKLDTLRDEFIWQLFTEGIAMVFEQEILNNPNSYHQYDDKWREWCQDNLDIIKQSFYQDIDTMTHDNQSYFGDWVKFRGYGDTGYYLGTQFVRYVMNYDSFDNIINYDIKTVKDYFERYMKEA